MSEYLIQEETLRGIADSIRAKTGKTDPMGAEQMATEIDSISAGGGGGGGEYLVQVIDYDGTVLKSEWHNEGDTFTLPEAPTSPHEGHTFTGWSSLVPVTDGAVTVGNFDLTIGAEYGMAGGVHEFDILLTPATGLVVSMQNFAITNNINWGDGTIEYAPTTVSHTYSQYGSYTIKIATTTTSIGSYLFGQSSSAKNCFLKEARLGSLVSAIGAYAFAYCTSMKSISMSKLVTTLGSYCFSNCYSLKAIVIPSECPQIGSYAFHYCYALSCVAIPSSVSSVSTGTFQHCETLPSISLPNGTLGLAAAFYYCQSLARVFIPNDARTTIGINAFSYCYALADIALPPTVTISDAGCFADCRSLRHIEIPNGVTIMPSLNGCFALSRVSVPSTITKTAAIGSSTAYSLELIDFSNHTAVPTLSSKSWNPANKSMIIRIPDTLYDEWIAATNWVNVADYIYKASEVNI